MGAHQWRFKSIRPEQKDQKTHSQETPCAYSTNLPQPSDQWKQIMIEQATMPVEAAPPNRGPSVIPMEDLFRKQRDMIAIWSRFQRQHRRFFEKNLQVENKMVQHVPKWRQRVIKAFSDVQSWNFDTMLEMSFLTSSNKMRLECCLDARGKNLNTWDQYQATVAYQKLIPNSLRYLRFRRNEQLTSVIQDLRTITGQSVKEDWLQEAPLIAEEDKHASAQRCVHWKFHCIKKAMSPQAYPRWCLFSIQTDQFFSMQLTYLTWRSHKTEDWHLIKPAISAQHYADRSMGKSGEIQQKRFGDRHSFREETNACRRSYTHVQFIWNRRRPSAATVEPARGNPLRENSEHAECSHIDFRIQGEPVQSSVMKDQEKNSCVKLLMKQVLESPNTKSNDGGMIPKERRKGSTKIFLRTSKIFLKYKTISKLMQCSWTQTQYIARRVTIMQTLATHIAYVYSRIQGKWRSQGTSFFFFLKKKSWIVSKYPRLAHSLLELGNPRSLPIVSQSAWPSQECQEEPGKNQHSWSISGSVSEQNTFSQCMYRCAHCVSASHCTHSLYHILVSRSFGLCAQNGLRLLCSVSRHAQYTQHSVFYISDYHWSSKVDHFQKPLCWFTKTQRCQFYGSRTSHRLWAQQDRRQHDCYWTGDCAFYWRESDSRHWGKLLFTLYPVTVVFYSRCYWKHCYASRSRLGRRTPRYLPEREASAERSQIYHSEREGFKSSSSQSLNFRRLVALFWYQKRLSQDAFSEREQPVFFFWEEWWIDCQKL